MKVLVLGANGFIGKRLLREVLAAGKSVKILTRKPNPSLLDNVEIFQGDLLDESLDVDDLVSDCDLIFNCAGEIRNEPLMYDLHVKSTGRLLEALQRRLRHDSVSCHWVQLSSVGAYGPAPGIKRLVTEETQTRPIGPYEETKTQADELIILAARSTPKLSFSILRPSNVYGPEMPNSSLRQLANFIRRRIFFFVGFERAIATYIHVDDVVDCLMLCGTEPAAKNEIFNISNDCYMDEMINGLAKAQGVPKPFLKIPEGLVRALVKLVSKLGKLPVTQERIDALIVKTSYPNTKLQSVLGFKPARPVPETIGDIFK